MLLLWQMASKYWWNKMLINYYVNDCFVNIVKPCPKTLCPKTLSPKTP